MFQTEILSDSRWSEDLDVVQWGFIADKASFETRVFEWFWVWPALSPLVQ